MGVQIIKECYNPKCMRWLSVSLFPLTHVELPVGPRETTPFQVRTSHPIGFSRSCNPHLPLSDHLIIYRLPSKKATKPTVPGL